MAGIWPFKKKVADETDVRQVIEYDSGNEEQEQLLADRSHIEDNQFKAALDVLNKPHLDKQGDGKGEKEKKFEQSEDGYWYLRKDDGSFDPTPYIKGEDGSFKPFQSS